MSALQAVAESWASIDGKLYEFRLCRERQTIEDKLGHYEGYMSEAQEMIDRLRKRGFDVTRIDKTPKQD